MKGGWPIQDLFSEGGTLANLSQTKFASQYQKFFKSCIKKMMMSQYQKSLKSYIKKIKISQLKKIVHTEDKPTLKYPSYPLLRKQR